MKQIVNDPVLHFTASLVSVIKWVMWVGVAICGLMLILSAIGGIFGISIAEQDPLKWQTDAFELGTFAIFMALAGLLCFLLALFFRTLRAVIDSVQQGSPLSFANAEKLKYMAKILSGALALGLLLDISGGYLIPDTADGRVDYVDVVGNFLTTLLPILLLFILSRIFERGAEMREELEGTV